jgi:hypothetical protein
MTASQYKELVKWAALYVGGDNIAAAEDAASDAILAVFEKDNTSDGFIDIAKVKAQIRDTYYNQSKINKRLPKESSKLCKKCNEVKPALAFSIIRRSKDNSEVLFHYCKPCQAQIVKKYNRSEKGKKTRAARMEELPEAEKARRLKAQMKRYHAKKRTTEYREFNRKNFKTYCDNNREKINAANREREKYHRENLTDRFIKRILRSQKVKNYHITPLMIEEKRRELLLTRTAHP